MKIATAQLNCTVGNIEQNLQAHYLLLEKAIEQQVELIVFPEMSITGYCREEGQELAFSKDDKRLERLKEIARTGNIIIIVGAPIKIDKKLYIGAFVLHPNKPLEIYTKQFLHDGEELFYASSKEYNPTIPLKGEKLMLAICADINTEDHPRQAKDNNATIYLPGIFFSENGIDKGSRQLQQYAEKYSMNILMSNYSGELWGMKSGGQSAFWNSNGVLMDHLNQNDSGMLIIMKENEKWSSHRVVLD